MAVRVEKNFIFKVCYSTSYWFHNFNNRALDAKISDPGSPLNDHQWSYLSHMRQAKTEISIMEVHHHRHVEKRNFAAYLLEFIMIFLAAALGFFAEGLREHMDDRSKEYELWFPFSGPAIKIKAEISKRNEKIINPCFHFLHPFGKLWAKQIYRQPNQAVEQYDQTHWTVQATLWYYWKKLAHSGTNQWFFI